MANSRQLPGQKEEYTRTRLLNRLGLFQVPSSSGGGRRCYASSSMTIKHPAAGDLRTTLHPSVVRSYYGKHQQNGRHRRTPSLLKDVVPTVTKLKDNSKDEKFTTPNDFHLAVIGDNDQQRSQENEEKILQSAIAALSLSPPSNTNTSSSPSNKLLSIYNINNNTNNSPSVQFNENVSVMSIPSRYQYSNRIKKFLWSTKEEIMENAERNILEYEYEGWDYNKVVLDDDMFVDTVSGDLIHPCHLNENGQPIYYNEEEGEEDDDDDDDDDDHFFKPLERQSSVATATSQ